MRRILRQILDLHSREERWRVGGVLVAAACTGLIETFSVASIMPFMAVAANPALARENEILAWLQSVSGAESESGFLLFLALLVLGILLVSHAFIALTTWLVARFVWRKHHDLSEKLLGRYLSQPYPFFLGRNTAELSEYLLREIETVVRGVLYPGLDVLVKAVISLLIVGFLAYIDALLALLVAVVLGGAYLILWGSLRGWQGAIGEEQLDANRRRFKVATEAFQGIKELKALGRESRILARYDVESRRFSRHSTQHELAARLPRNVMEVIAFGGVLLVVVYLLAVRGGFQEALPVLAAFTFAGYKLMPALQGVFAGLVQIRFHAPSLEAVHEDLFSDGGMLSEGAAELAEREPLPFRDAIVLDGVRYGYDPGEPPVLREVTLRIEKGQMVGFVGATGSGKTTLVDLILGLLAPGEGEVRVDGLPLSGERRLRWRRSVGYVPQEIFLSDESVLENIALGMPSDLIDRERAVRAARIAQVHGFIQGLPRGYDTVVGERGVRLSGGQRQRIGIARALYADPPVLVLDEGTSDLDGVTEAAVTRAVREEDPERTVLWIAHRLRTVERCDRIYLLDRGAVADSGTYEDLLRTSDGFRALARAGGDA